MANGAGVLANADASRGALRPSIPTPVPLISATRSAPAGSIAPYAPANSLRTTNGSSSNRSSDSHATLRSSVRAHSASNVDLPYPAGAVTPTTRASLERTRWIRVLRLTAPARGSGIRNFDASSSCSRSSARARTSAAGASITPKA